MMTPTPRRYRGISAEERRAARRRQLLDAALEIAGTRGVERTTMTAICSEAGLTERYFYESFDARDQLLLALVDEIAEQVRTAVLTALSDTEGDTAARAHRRARRVRRGPHRRPPQGPGGDHRVRLRARVEDAPPRAVPRLRRTGRVTGARDVRESGTARPPGRDQRAAARRGDWASSSPRGCRPETGADVEEIVDEATRWFTAGMHT
jgi:AcrR family transcriptional regulator